MKVLHVGNVSSVGYLLCQGLRAKGVQADLISKKNDLFYNSQTENWIKYVKTPLEELQLAGNSLDQYDFIHAHYLLNWGTTGLRFKSTDTPVILHCHGSDTRPQNIVERILQKINAQKSKLMLFSTPDLLENIRWFSGEKIYCPNPVLIPLQSNNKNTGQVLIYTVLNRIKETERIFPFIEGLLQSFDMIAHGTDVSYYRKIAPKNIRFIEPVTKDKVPELLGGYSLILGGSMDGTIRICELEAMAQGIPTLFPFRYNHFYTQALPMPELTTANIQKYIGDFDLGQKQREWVENFHSVDVVAQILINIYQSFGAKAYASSA